MRYNDYIKTKNTRDTVYESPYSTILEESYQARGGYLTFARSSNNDGELHVIRLHETVEATIPIDSTSSRIDEEKPFNIISTDETFTSRGFKSPSIHTESGMAIVLSDNESLGWLVEDSEGFDIATENGPSTLSTVFSTSGIRQDGKRVISLYVDSGNIYAGVET